MTVLLAAESALADLDIAGEGTTALVLNGTRENVSLNVTNVGGADGEFESLDTRAL